MARIFRALLIAAVNAIQEFFAFATKECLEEGLVNITNNGCTDLGDGLYQGGSGKSLEMSDILPITNANSWEFQTRYTYKSSAGQCTLLGYVDPASNDYKTPWIFIQSNRMYLRINNMSVWQSTFILEIDKTYDIKVGFTGTAYYIDAKLDTDENYTNYLTQSSTTKQNNTAPIMLMDLGYRTTVNQYYNNGIIDMTRTKFIIDGITTYFWSEVLEVGDTAKLNDGMATSNYDWSAYQSDTTVIGNYTATGTIEQIKQIGGDTIYVTAEPEQDNKDATINTGKIYYAYTNSNDESVYTTDSPIDGGTFNLENATEIGTLTNNNGIYSGFSDSNYLTCTNFLNNTQNSFEVVSKIYLTGTSSSNCSIIDTSQENSTSAFRFEINSSMKLQCRLSNVQGSFTYFATLQSNTILQLNTWYFVKVIYNSSTGYALYLTQDESNWHDPEATTSDTSMINHTQSTLFIGDNVSSNSSFPGYIDLSKTFITIDNVTTPSILYDSSFQELNPQPEFTIMQKGLQNATIYGSLTENNGVYSGFSSSNFIYLNTTTPQTSMDFIIKCNPSTDYGDLLRTQPDGKGILLRCSSGSVLCYLSSSGSGWNVLGGFNTGISMSAGTDIYVRITWNSSNGVYTFWQSLDGQNWTERNSSSSGLAAPYWSGGNQTIGGCTSYSEHWYGFVDMKETSLTIDGNKTTFYSTIDGIIINSDNYIKTSDNDLVQPITATIETVDNTTINSVTVSTPTQGYEDVTYYAYTNENDNTDSVYVIDNPISESPNPSTLYENTGTTEFTPVALDPQPEFTAHTQGLENATVVGTLTENDGVYSGFSTSNYLQTNSLTLGNNWELLTSFTTNTISGTHYILGKELFFDLYLTNDKLTTDVGNGNSWTTIIQKGNTSLQTNTKYYIKYQRAGNTYNVYLSTTPTFSDTPEITLPAVDFGSLQFSIGKFTASSTWPVFNGSIDMKETSITIDGQTTTFYSAFTGIQIGQTQYNRNSQDDKTVREDRPAFIETSANITTSNNDNVITDGSYHLFNLTVPASMTSIIESSGIRYQTNEMPLLLKNNTGLTLLLKDGNNAYYRNYWTINRDYDLHYQNITFATNVQDPTIIFKIKNAVVEAPYYCYCGDNYTYTIIKEGYVNYNGSGTVDYSSIDGNIINIEANLTPSTDTVDVTDYTYTIDNTGNIVITGYKGTSGDTTLPNITEE